MKTAGPPPRAKAPPPLYTVLADLVGWTMDRTADIPKNARFTLGQRLDGWSFPSSDFIMGRV